MGNKGEEVGEKLEQGRRLAKAGPGGQGQSSGSNWRTESALEVCDENALHKSIHI